MLHRGVDCEGSAFEVRLIMERLAERGPTPVAQLLELVPPSRQGLLERGLIWLARHDVVAILSQA